jgi:hypothetical protein
MRTILLLSGLCVIVLTGCSEKPDDMPRLCQVTATVMMEGKPLENALISCVPEGNETWFAGGVTDVKGRVTLRTKGRYNGIPLGHFKVIVIKTTQVEGSTPEKNLAIRIVHSKFGDQTTTPLTCTIEKTTSFVEFNVEPAPLNDWVED